MDDEFDLPLCPECLGRLEPVLHGATITMTCSVCQFQGESYAHEPKPYPELDESLPSLDDYR